MADEMGVSVEIDGEDVDCVAEYEVTDFYEVNLIAIRADLPGEPGPDLLPSIDKFEAERVAENIIGRLEWKKEIRSRGAY